MSRWMLLAGVVLCLLCAGTAAGASGSAVALVENASVTTQDGADVRIDSGIQTSGETELLVGISGDTADPVADEETTVTGLQARAEASQSSVRQFAARTPGVTVENRFWLTNAVLVRVDTDRVPVRALARIDGVESIARNVRVRAPDGQSVAESTVTPTASVPVVAPTIPAAPLADTVAAARAESTAGGTAAVASSSAVTSTPDTTSSPATTYGLDQIDAPEVWSNYNTQGEGTSVAVLDTGVDPDHPDIDLAKWAEFGVLGDKLDTQPQDYDDHGTHVSGTVAGGAASGQQIGVAPETTLSHGAVLTNCNDGDCSGFLSQIIAGMEWATANDADVVSMSLSFPSYAFGYIEAVRNAESAGTTVVAANGNDGEDTSGSPANVYDAISVGASDSNEDIAAFSSGEQVDTESAWGPGAPAEWPAQYIVPSVAGPGVSVESAVPGGGYGFKSGTSMGTPHVAGAIALIESATEIDPTPDEIARTLEATADKPADAPAPAGERDTRYGSGIINVSAAVEAFTTRPPTFRVRPLQSRAVVNDTALELSAEIANRGSREDTQTVTLTVGGMSQTRTETLAPGANTTVTFPVDTGTLGPGTYAYTISSNNESASGTLTIQTPAQFGVTVASPTTPVVAGESLSVDVQVANTGTANGTQTIQLDAGPLGTNATTVSLAGNASTTVTVGVSTAVGDYGTYTLTVSSANDTASTELSVSMPTLGEGPPADPDGDGLYEDVRGDGNVSTLDVQALFDYLHSDVVRTNSAAFNFQDFDTEVNILDVQMLFNLLPD